MQYFSLQGKRGKDGARGLPGEKGGRGESGYPGEHGEPGIKVIDPFTVKYSTY